MDGSRRAALRLREQRWPSGWQGRGAPRKLGDGKANAEGLYDLRIAAGNVANLVDLETGGLGAVVVDPLNGPQSTTLAKLNTLGILLSACVTAIPDACEKLFDAATPPGGVAPTDTLSAAQNIARHAWHNADKLFGLLDEFYPVPQGKRYRDVAPIPYLFYAPSAWTLSLVYSGGGFFAVGGIAIDQQDRIWITNSGSNTVTRFPASDPGKAEEIEVGFSPHAVAIDGNDNVWVASATSHSVTQFCGVRTETCPPGLKTGDPITPSEGDIGGLQAVAPIALDPAGKAWVGNGWNDTEAGFSEVPPEAQSTRFAAHTIVVFFGVAKPVHTPLMGPVETPLGAM